MIALLFGFILFIRISGNCLKRRLVWRRILQQRYKQQPAARKGINIGQQNYFDMEGIKPKVENFLVTSGALIRFYLFCFPCIHVLSCLFCLFSA